MEQIKIGDKVKVWDRSSHFHNLVGTVTVVTDFDGTKMVSLELEKRHSIFGSNVVVNDHSVIKL